MSVGEMLAATVPMARTLNLEFLETTAERAVVRLPDQTDFHNHVGGPHAGAMFTLAESASGAIVLAAFGDQMTRAVPLAVKAEIGYKKLAMGAVTATATLGRPIADVRRRTGRGRAAGVPGGDRHPARGRRRDRRDDDHLDPAPQRLRAAARRASRLAWRGGRRAPGRLPDA